MPLSKIAAAVENCTVDRSKRLLREGRMGEQGETKKSGDYPSRGLQKAHQHPRNMHTQNSPQEYAALIAKRLHRIQEGLVENGLKTM